MIEVTNVSKHFKTNKKQREEMLVHANYIDAVSEVSLVCKPGRIFSLLGPNGAGKTTLLRMIACMIRPDFGKILVCGFDTVKESQKIRRSIGFLTGGTSLYLRLTAEENIKYFADLYGIEKNEYKKRKEMLFEILGINEFAKKRYEKLSSGMKQKVSIARTLINDPEVLVFDEATAGLDVITSRNIISIIKDCKSRGKTVIFSTHIMGEADLLSDDLAIIHKGKFVFNDTFENFKKNMKTRNLENEFIQYVTGEP